MANEYQWRVRHKHAIKAVDIPQALRILVGKCHLRGYYDERKLQLVTKCVSLYAQKSFDGIF